MVSLSVAAITTSLNSVMPLILYAALMAAHFAAEPARWRLLFLETCSWSFLKWFHLHNFTALLSYLLPAKLGIPLRLGLIRQQTQLPMTKVLAGLGTDAILYYGAWALVAATLISASPSLRARFMSGNALWVLAAIFLVAGVGLIVRSVRSARQESYPTLPTGGLANLRSALRAASRLPRRRLALVLGLVLADVLAEGLRQACLAAALGITVPATTMMMVGIIGFAAGLFSFMPMGLGAYDAAVILLLSEADIPPAQLLGLLAGNRVALLAFSGLSGTVGAIKLKFRPSQLKSFRDLVLRRKQTLHSEQKEI